MAMTCTNHTDVQEGVDTCSRCHQPFCTDCLVSLDGRRLCAACKEIVREPRGRYLGLRLAGLPSRALAFMIDTTIMMIAVYGVYWPIGLLDDYFETLSRNQGLVSAMPILIAISSPSYLMYMLPPIVFTLLLEGCLLQWRSQSVGKMLTRLKVVGPNGQRVTASQAWLRAIARSGFVLFGVLTYVDYLAVFVGNGRATLHDRIASTRVVRE
jgi:uncharacterized RDD family membrane protein YckC